MRRPLGLIVLALVAGTLVPAVSAAGVTNPPSPDLQRLGVRLVDVPVSEAHNPRGLRYIIDYLAVGMVVHRRILIMNEDAEAAHVTVYPDAARITQGRFIGAAGQTRSELTSWITVAQPALTLAAHASVTDMVTIKVPDAATRGEQYGVIWVQQAGLGRNAGGFAIKDVIRVGVRVYLAVGRGGAPPTNFAISSITGHRSAHGQPTLTARVSDIGGRAVDVSGTVQLTGGPGGTSAGPFRVSQIITLAPGQSGIVTFVPGRGLPAGPWRATITLASGFTTRTASATVLFSTQVASSVFTRPTAMAIGAVLIAALLALALIIVHRVRQTRRGTTA